MNVTAVNTESSALTMTQIYKSGITRLEFTLFKYPLFGYLVSNMKIKTLWIYEFHNCRNIIENSLIFCRWRNSNYWYCCSLEWFDYRVELWLKRKIDFSSLNFQVCCKLNPKIQITFKNEENLNSFTLLFD